MLEQFFVTLLEVPQFATTKLKLRLHGLAFHQHGLSCFQRDDGVRDALDATEKKSRSMPWVVGLHPVFEIEVAHGQLMGIKQGFIVQRDAVSTIGKLTVDDGIVDAFRAEPQFIPSGAIERSRQISRRRDGGQDFLRVTP